MKDALFLTENITGVKGGIMGSAMSIGLALGGLNAASTLLNAGAQSGQLAAQAEAQKAQARNYELQARETAERGALEARQIDARKSQLRRQYQDAQSRNRTLLATGNVDMTSGSAMDTARGNAETFSADMGDNAYERIMKIYETDQSVNRLNVAAQNSRKQASALRSQSDNWLPTLLNTAISGTTGFASGYTMAGGSLKSLWSKADPKKTG